ncbi:DUF2125 domain-containing protein [Yoonia sp. BS5-3]|uniref:DUF2125 domain-containing protein n=1 Tax=Yoonia phaeophyticola TaxID=3137369 RepID=A0ABZ2V5P8_9RHOB
MKYSAGLKGAVCGAALIAGGAAQADVTAAEVWEDWKAQIAIYGEDAVSIGGENQSGDTLTVSDLVVNFSDEDVTIDIDLGDVTFVEQGDGSVAVTMEDSFPASLKDDFGLEVNFEVSQTGFEMIVSGDPGALSYDLRADTYTFALVDITEGDETFTADARFVANDVRSVYNMQVNDMRTVDFEGSMASLDLLVDVAIPESDGEYVTISGKYEGFNMEGQAVVPLDFDMENPEAAFADGLSYRINYAVDNMAGIFDIDVDGDQLAGSASNGETTLDMDFSNDGISYDVALNDLAVNVTASQLPFPVEVGLAQYGVAFEMPLSKSEEAREFGLSLDLVDLTLNDLVWNLFDPGTVLPRDPATVQFAISGLAKPLIDMLNPEDLIYSNDMPFELESVSLDRLNVSVAGAAVTGVGEFTFDSSDMTTFAPLPKPEGDVVIEGSGINGLMDNLVAMGLIAEQDLMAPRMMMGMFARSTGDDRLESKLEINAEGHVLANGQRLR